MLLWVVFVYGKKPLPAARLAGPVFMPLGRFLHVRRWAALVEQIKKRNKARRRRQYKQYGKAAQRGYDF